MGYFHIILADVSNHTTLKELEYLQQYKFEVMCSGFLQDDLSSRQGGTTTIWDSGIGGLSSTSYIATQLEGEEDIMSVALDSNIFQNGDKYGKKEKRLVNTYWICSRANSSTFTGTGDVFIF